MRSKEISIGGYLPANSILHKLDPRTKLFGLTAMLATVFLIPCSYKIFFPFLAAVLALLLSGLGWRVWIDGLRKFRLMLLFTLILNFALNRDGLPIQIHGFVTPFSYDGLASAVFLTARIVLAVIFSLSLTFTTLPLKIASFIGFLFSLFGFLVLVYVILRYVIDGSPVPGFTFLVSIIALFSGAQLVALGIIGVYLARMHQRTMERPAYLLREITRLRD